MKKIKSFEEFGVNEISQYLANKALRDAELDISDTETNIVKRKIRKDQRDKFVKYINPEIKNKAEALGFYDLDRYNKNYYFKYTINNTENYDFTLDITNINKLRVVYNDVDIPADKVPSNILRKVNNLFNMIKNSEAGPTNPNEL